MFRTSVRRLSLCVSIFLCAAALSAQTTTATPTTTPTTSTAPTTSVSANSRIFAINLSNQSIDLRFGKDGAFVTQGLSAITVSQLVVFDASTPRSILYRSSGASDWQETKKGDASTLYYAITGGKTYAIIVQANGIPALYELQVSDGKGAHFAVINASNHVLASVQLGAAFNQSPVAKGTAISTGWTDFVSIDSGNFGAFWQYDKMPDGVGYFYTPGKDGKSVGLTTFNDSSWYVLLIWHDAARDVSGGVIWDISPSP